MPGTRSESILVHEIAHQWYGNAVSPSDWGSIWVSEGQGTYAPLYWREKNGGPTTAQSLYDQWQRVPEHDARWQIAPGAMTEQTQLYGWHSYNRAAMMYEALRQSVGDKTFHKIMRTYVQDNLGQSLNGRDFQEHAERVSGKDLDEFFDEWIYQGDKPAWPSVWDYDLKAKATDQRGVSISRGSVVTYTLSATNKGQVSLNGGELNVNLADVLDDATIDVASLPEGVTLSGTTLTWDVPEVSGTDTATVSFTVTAKSNTSKGSKLIASSDSSLGGFCAAKSKCQTKLVVARG